MLLAGPLDAVRVLDRRRVDLSDPADADLRQPYHARTGVELTDSAILAWRIEAIEARSRDSFVRLLEQYQEGGYTPHGSSLLSP